MYKDNEKSLLTLVQNHMLDYPDAAVQDIYKLLYQGAMGPGHIMHNPEAACNYLQQEWQSLTAEPQAQLTETVATNGQVIRVHLRPLKALLANPKPLWQAMYNSAHLFIENKALFLEQWQHLRTLIVNNLLPFTIEQFTELDAGAQRDNYPPIHHSARYRSAYRPAYRILLADEFKTLKIIIEDTRSSG